MFKDVEIKMPWGCINGQWFGDYSQRPILAICELQNGFNKFSHLAQLIAKQKSILCIDLPAHESYLHYANNSRTYDQQLYARSIFHIMRYYKWSHVSLLSHTAMGAYTNLSFALLYPECVDVVISIDCPIENCKKSESDYKPYKLMDHNVCCSDDKLTQILGIEPPAFTTEEMLHHMNQSAVRTYILELLGIERPAVKPLFNHCTEVSKALRKKVEEKVLPVLVIEDVSTMNSQLQSQKQCKEFIKHHKNFNLFSRPMATHYVYLNSSSDMAQVIADFFSKHADSTRMEKCFLQSKI